MHRIVCLCCRGNSRVQQVVVNVPTVGPLFSCPDLGARAVHDCVCLCLPTTVIVNVIGAVKATCLGFWACRKSRPLGPALCAHETAFPWPTWAHSQSFVVTECNAERRHVHLSIGEHCPFAWISCAGAL